MKRIDFVTMVLVGFLLILSPAAASGQGGSSESDQPALILAVAPTYPGIARAARAEGEVTVEVKIDAAGKVTAATSVSGHPLLQKASEMTAMRWQFAASQANKAERTARLVFAYATTAEYKRDDPEYVVYFKPPYRVEVKFSPPVVH